MQRVRSSPSPRDAFRNAYERVTKGSHLSSELESLFQSVGVQGADASLIRHRLYQAIRYTNWEGAWQGALDGVIDEARMAIPLWLRERLLQKNSHALVASLQDAPTFVRVNTLKTTVAKAMEALAPFQPEHVEHECLRVNAPFGLFRSRAFQMGWFEQQDINSQRVSRELLRFAKARWKRCVDLCAGAGGKTLHMAALSSGTGTIIALDIVSHKLSQLAKRAARAGAHNVEARHITSTKIYKRLYDTADVVLVDAPCSGTGVLRRNPDIALHLTEQGLQELLAIQANIFLHAVRMCKPGGVIGYATCSILDEEALPVAPQEVGLTLLHRWETAIGDSGGDGFVMTILRK